MPQNPDQVLKGLKDGDFAPVYFLYGEESFFIDQVVSFIEKNAIPEAEKGFNQIIMYGKDVNIGQAISTARGFPMMGQRQLVMIKEAQELSDWKKEEAVDLLMKYVQSPQPSTILVFAHKHKKLDNRSKLSKALDKSAIMMESAKIYENKVPAWLSKHATDLGYQITDKAAFLLTEYLGNNLERIHNELVKIGLSAKDKIIDDQLVKNNVGVNKDYNTFELGKAIATRDFVKAIKIVDYLGADLKNNPPMLVIGYLYSYLSKLLLLHGTGQPINDNLAATELRIHPFVAKEYVMAARNYPPAKLIQNMHHLRNADMQLKGVNAANMEAAQIYQELMFKIIH